MTSFVAAAPPRCCRNVTSYMVSQSTLICDWNADLKLMLSLGRYRMEITVYASGEHIPRGPAQLSPHPRKLSQYPCLSSHHLCPKPHIHACQNPRPSPTKASPLIGLGSTDGRARADRAAASQPAWLPSGHPLSAANPLGCELTDVQPPVRRDPRRSTPPPSAPSFSTAWVRPGRPLRSAGDGRGVTGTVLESA